MAALSDSDKDNARAVRTNVFVMATLYSESSSAPVKIRNLSPSGALIEGMLIPSKGTPLSLRRGSLNVAGAVAWTNNGRAGVEFEAPTSVGPWLPGGEKMLKQGRIEAIIHGAKEQLLPSARAALPRPGPITQTEIEKSRDMLQALADSLVDDMNVVLHHGDQLQSLDFAIQVLGRLALAKNLAD